jgi:hypothetical protein
VKRAHPAWVTALAALLAPAGCRDLLDQGPPPVEETAVMASDLPVNDPRAGIQLVGGFFNLEADAWRWTGREFEVALKVPAAAAGHGARLSIHVVVTQGLLDLVGSTALACQVNGEPLAPETFTQPGDYEYAREVTAQALAGKVASIECEVDKPVPPRPHDPRELGLVVKRFTLAARPPDAPR